MMTMVVMVVVVVVVVMVEYHGRDLKISIRQKPFRRKSIEE